MILICPEVGGEVKRKKLAIRAKVPWDFWSDVYAGVIQPLHDDQLRITIEVEAEGEIDENTINLKIKETLDQIGAEVERFDVVDEDADAGKGEDADKDKE